MDKVAIIIGDFDPIHEGHIQLFEKIKTKYEILCVIARNEDQLNLTKGYNFQHLSTREKILNALIYVDWVLPSRDYNVSCLKSLDLAVKYYRKEFYKDIVLCTTPETRKQEKILAEMLGISCIEFDFRIDDFDNELVKAACKNVSPNRDK